MRTRYITISIVIIAAGFSLWYFGPARARVTYLYNLRGGEDSGLVGYWPLDNGRADDLSKNHNDGTLTNGPVAAAGKVNGALSFDGVDDYVDALDSNSLDITNAITLSAWVYPTGNLNPTWFTPIHRKVNAYTTAIVSGTFQYDVNVSDWAWKDSGFTVTANTWYYITLTFDGTNQRFYVNGNLESTTAESGSIITNANDFRIGGDTENAQYFKGSIDDVRIYNRALSANEIKEYYDATSAGHFVDSAPTLVNTTDSVNLQSGLVGHWSMDGNNIDWATGNVADSSGQGNNGTAVSMSTSTSPTAGVIGQALSFDGVNDYVSVADDNSLDFAAADSLSISVWLKTTDTSGTRHGIVQKADGSSPFTGYWLRMTDVIAGEISWQIYPGTVRRETNEKVNDGIWHHIVATYNGNSSYTGMKVYIDGIEATYKTGSGTLSGTMANSETLKIGSTSVPEDFNGTIDDVRIYNRALSATEVKQLYNSTKILVNTTPKNVLTTGLVGHWTFDGNNIDWATGAVADSSGQGNNGKVVAMATSTAPTEGVLGQGLSFDGVDDYVSVANSSTLIPGSSSWTLSAWARPPNADIVKPIIVKREPLGDFRQYYMGVNGANSHTGPVGKKISCVYLDQSGTSERTAYTTNDVSDGEWHLITCVWDKDANDYYIFIDGVSVAITKDFNAGVWPTIDNTDRLTIANNNATNYANFPIDDVRIYDRALTKFEINQLYQMGR